MVMSSQSLFFASTKKNTTVFSFIFCTIEESFEKKFHVTITMDGILEDEQTNTIVSTDHTHNRYLTILHENFDF